LFVLVNTNKKTWSKWNLNTLTRN